MLTGAEAASFPSCKDYPQKDAFITFAVAAAACGYIASLHGVCLYRTPTPNITTAFLFK